VLVISIHQRFASLWKRCGSRERQRRRKDNGRIELDAEKSALKKRTALAVKGKATAPFSDANLQLNCVHYIYMYIYME
jgi:hypothetical protein